MRLYDFLDNVEIQSEYKTYWYDWENEERVIATEYELSECEVICMYCENECIFIEVEKED